MWSKEAVEDFISKNRDKIKQGKALLELVKKIEFKVLDITLTIYTCGTIIRCDLKFDNEKEEKADV